MSAIEQDWPADNVERRAVSTLVPYARNARTHSPEQVTQLVASMRQWGWTNPVLIDEGGGIIAGHGRVLAAKQLGLEEVPVMVARGWSEAQKRAYVIADNKLALNAGWDEDLLGSELHALQEMEFDLGVIGFDAAELNDLGIEVEFEDEQASAEDEAKGSLLALMHVTIADPRTKVLRGEAYRLGPHTLHACSVTRGWQQWQPYLTLDCIFCPYPGPLVFASHAAQKHPLLLVQPDPYICGHICDRWLEVNGPADFSRLLPT